MGNSITHELVNRKWSILLFTALGTLATLFINLALPDEYLSQASLLPANSKMTDKQRLFNDNIQELYSAYGTAEDLDRLYATMHSGAVMQHVADSLDLVTHYGLKGKKNSAQLARRKLDKQVKLVRSEYGELIVRVWDEDAAKAAAIAGAMISRTQQVFDGIYFDHYDRAIANLRRELRVAGGDSTSEFPKQEVLQRTIAEYTVSRLNPPSAFFVMEKPGVSVVPDRPNIPLNVLISFCAALVTALTFFVATRIMSEQN